MIKRKNIDVFFVIVTILFILYRDFLNTNMPLLIFSILCAVSGICMNSSGRFFYIIALLPFCRGIPYSEMILIILVIDVVFSIFARKIPKITAIVPVLLIAIIEIADYVFFGIFSVNVAYVIVYMIFVSYAVGNKVYDKAETRYMVGYALSTAVAVLSVILREILHYGLDKIFEYNIRFGANAENMTVTQFNSNELGLYSVVATAILLVLYQKKRSAVNLFCAIAISIIGFVSVSRTYLLLIMLTWLLFLWMNGTKPTQFVLPIIMLLFTVLIVALAVPRFAEWIIRFYEDRVDQAASDGMSGRTEIAGVYLSLVLTNLWTFFFGHSQNYLVTNSMSYNIAAHNAIIETVVCWGAVGFCVAIYWIYNLYKKMSAKASRKNRYITYLPFIAFFIFVQTIQLFTMHCYILVMFVSMLALRYNGGSNESEIKTNN